MHKQKIDRILGVFAIFTVALAWVIGAKLTTADVTPYLQMAVPSAHHFTPKGDGFVIMADSTEDAPMGYVSIASANGYGGPMQVLVAVDMQGKIIGMSIVQHKETPNWINRIFDKDFISSLVGKSYQDAFQIGGDVNAITGATYTSRALAEAAMLGSRAVAAGQLGLDVPQEAKPKIRFGVPEITLIGLYIVGFFGHQRKFKYTKQARWITMLVGLIVLGFIYTRPLTLVDINKLLLGFWPTWQENLYWYLLIGGILFVFTIDNKNPYCEWFCPFGAAQECMGAIGGAKTRSIGRYKEFFIWVQRGLAWAAIMIAMLFRNPGLSSYEIFGTLFDLNGSLWQFALLGIVLLASLFMRRPWCSFLCPIRPVTDLYRTFRKWMIETWNLLRTKKAA